MTRHGSLLALALATALAAASAQAQLTPIRINETAVMAEDQTRIYAHGAWEVRREDNQRRDFDNLRVGPIGVRHGLGERFEAGAALTLSGNSEDDPGAPDETGIEGLAVFGKLGLNRHIALQLGFNVFGDDDIRPYPNDGIDFFVNFPMRRELADGLLYGEIGYTVKEEGGGSNFFNFGVGYAYPLGEDARLNFELVGDENPTGRNHMALLGGVGFDAGENLRLAPYVSIGVFDASPDVSLGASFEIRL